MKALGFLALFTITTLALPQKTYNTNPIEVARVRRIEQNADHMRPMSSDGERGLRQVSSGREDEMENNSETL
jgi:hypothetical protein